MLPPFSIPSRGDTKDFLVSEVFNRASVCRDIQMSVPQQVDFLHTNQQRSPQTIRFKYWEQNYVVYSEHRKWIFPHAEMRNWDGVGMSIKHFHPGNTTLLPKETWIQPQNFPVFQQTLLYFKTSIYLSNHRNHHQAALKINQCIQIYSLLKKKAKTRNDPWLIISKKKKSAKTPQILHSGKLNSGTDTACTKKAILVYPCDSWKPCSAPPVACELPLSIE